MRWLNGEFEIDDDRGRIQVEAVFNLLAGSYWALGRTRETIERSIDGSLCFGLYRVDHQIGFARMITDKATFAYLCDVIVEPGFRGRGLGKWLVGCAVEHPDVRLLRQALMTRDAHGLYEKFGFERSESMGRRANYQNEVTKSESEF